MTSAVTRVSVVGLWTLSVLGQPGLASAIPLAFDWTAVGHQSGVGFGGSVASAGDVNGDGYDDVIAGAPSYDLGAIDEGRAFLFLGSPAGLSIAPDWTVEGHQSYAYFGSSVASAGDVNGDGYDDVIAGAPTYDRGGVTDEGRAF